MLISEVDSQKPRRARICDPASASAQSSHLFSMLKLTSRDEDRTGVKRGYRRYVECSCYKFLAEISEKAEPIFNYQQMLIVSPGATSDITTHQGSQDQVVRAGV